MDRAALGADRIAIEKNNFLKTLAGIAQITRDPCFLIYDRGLVAIKKGDHGISTFTQRLDAGK